MRNLKASCQWWQLHQWLPPLPQKLRNSHCLQSRSLVAPPSTCASCSLDVWRRKTKPTALGRGNTGQSIFTSAILMHKASYATFFRHVLTGRRVVEVGLAMPPRMVELNWDPPQSPLAKPVPYQGSEHHLCPQRNKKKRNKEPSLPTLSQPRSGEPVQNGVGAYCSSSRPSHCLSDLCAHSAGAWKLRFQKITPEIAPESKDRADLAHKHVCMMPLPTWTQKVWICSSWRTMAMEKTPFTFYLHGAYWESGRNRKVNQKLLFRHRVCFSWLQAEAEARTHVYTSSGPKTLCRESPDPFCSNRLCLPWWLPVYTSGLVTVYKPSPTPQPQLGTSICSWRTCNGQQGNAPCSFLSHRGFLCSMTLSSASPSKFLFFFPWVWVFLCFFFLFAT